MALKYTEEFLRKQEKKGIPRSFYLGEEYQKEQNNKKKYNSIPYNMKNRLDGLSDEGFSGRSLDDLYEVINLNKDED